MKNEKGIEKTPLCSRNIAKGEISLHVETFTKSTKSLIELRMSVTPTYKLRESMKAIIESLNNMERVEVASPFWVNATEVLENNAKRMRWLQMPEAVCLQWMTR